MPLSFPPPTASPMRAIVLLLLASSLLVVPVAGFPSGAGGCVTGDASVSGLHIPSTTGDITLSGNGIEVSVDGTVLVPGTPLSITAGEEHEITVSATGTTPFRGFLIALSTATELDLSAALSPQDTAIAQIAGACSAPLFGVTHTSRDDKTTATALLNLAEDAELVLDVTAVILNSGGVSQYGYGGFQLSNGAGGAAVTSAPTTAPVAAATGAPVAAATGAPVAVPAVSSAPTTAPVAAATPSTAVPATPTYGGGGGVPTWTMSDVPSLVPTPGTGGGGASDVPSVIPTVDDEPSPPSPPSSSSGGGGEPDSGSGGGSSGADSALGSYYVSALAACAVAAALAM